MTLAGRGEAAAERALRLGVFGGTFDPVHFGHLRPAVELVERFALDRLLLIPNHRPVHRRNPGASTAQRIAMLRIATRGVAHIHVDTREATRDRPSWTVDTLEELRKEHPEALLVFFMGTDAFAEFDTWHRWQRILELAALAVVERPGAVLSEFADTLIRHQQAEAGEHIGPASQASEAGGLRDSSAGVIERVTVTQLAISATAIRRRVNGGCSTRFLLPDRVREYISAHGLYR